MGTGFSADDPLGSQLRGEGFAHVGDLGLADGAYDEVRRLLDPLFVAFEQLPPDSTRELAGRTNPHGPPVVPEVLDVSTLQPALRRTEVFTAVSALARTLLGPRTYLTYDHAIYKPPGPSAPTSWHQDSGFDEVLTHGLAVWVPLQATRELDGCMYYVPRSHLAGRLAHDHLVTDSRRAYQVRADTTGAIAIPCELGGVTIHDFHTVHGAGANKGGTVRRAWILNFSTTSWPRRLVRRGKFAVRTARGSAARIRGVGAG